MTVLANLSHRYGPVVCLIFQALSCREGEFWSGKRTDGSRVAEVETGKETNATGETHDTGEDAAGDTGGRNALHEGHGSGDGGAESNAVHVVAGTGIAENALEVTEKTMS